MPLTTNDVYQAVEDRCRVLLSGWADVYAWFEFDESVAVTRGIVHKASNACLIGYVTDDYGFETGVQGRGISLVELTVSLVIILQGEGQVERQRIEDLNDAMDTCLNRLGPEPNVRPQWYTEHGINVVRVGLPVAVGDIFQAYAGRRIPLQASIKRI